MHNPSHFFVTIDKKFYDQQGGIFIDTSFRPGWHATVTGKIASCPPNSALGLKRGDEVAFNYLVVFDQQHTADTESVFYEEPPDNQFPNPFITVWSNHRKEMIVRRYRLNEKYDAALVVNGIIEDKVEGNFGVIEDFMGRFTFESTNNIVYRNAITIDGQEYWKVRPDFIYAKKEGDDIEAIKGHYLMKEMKMVTEESESGLIVPFEERQRDMRAVILAGEGSVRRGDRVIVDRERMQQYTFWDQDFILAREDQIMARAI